MPSSVRIEVLGPSGVGKSTILAAAERLRPPSGTWWGPEQVAAGMSVSGPIGEALDDPALRDFVDACLDIVHGLPVSPSSKIAMLTMLRRSARDQRAADLLDVAVPVVHDELLLHRAFSILPQSPDVERDAATFFELAPTPRAAVVVTGDVDTILARVAARGTQPNCYAGLDDAGLRTAVEAALRACEIAAQRLRARGVDVLELDAGPDVDHTAQQLHTFITSYLEEPTMTESTDPDDVRARLLAASGSFRKKAGRHELRTRDVMYCAFSTPNFTVRADEAQRDAARRLERFGITADLARGKSALDLGSNAGAMLFELNNLGVASGLGVEFDQDKVDLATEIAALSDLDRLTFRQGDIDELDAAELGTFDIVLALAIEAHVQQPDRLYRLLGQVAASTLYFEGNGNCDVEAATAQLKAAGFADVESIGFCDDDRDPRNNNRPMLVARKKVSRGLFGRRK